MRGRSCRPKPEGLGRGCAVQARRAGPCGAGVVGLSPKGWAEAVRSKPGGWTVRGRSCRPKPEGLGRQPRFWAVSSTDQPSADPNSNYFRVLTLTFRL